ncbi:SwmB domain-containing protein [Verminephrobacter aporrectodeae]|uniref:SwmB domain-containing protein n=1 Tax=Verminephrobacter aporrectodeae TaxID=1110389 RepID=UPI002238427D|nr:SwmB domain-containing protein [Verminephrobacter aporrectodeae]
MSTQLNITLANSRLKAGDTTTVTFAFNEAVTNFTRDDVVLSDANGTLGEPTTSDNGRTWTATFTPTANVEDDSNTISVNLAGVTNTAGTAGSGQASSTNYSIDTRRPTLTITVADEYLGIGETTTATFTFSEAVTGFTGQALGIYGGLKVSISDPHPSGTSSTVWTATVTPVSNGHCEIGIDMWTVTDLAGNAGLREVTYSANSVIVDLVRPTAASTNPITLADTDLGLGETTTVTFRFSEAVTGFTLDDIDLSQAHGTLSGLRSTSGDGSSGDTWTALFTPTANTTSLTNTLGINLSGVRDIAGNAGQGSVRSGNYAVKTQGLTATITLADTALAVGETTTVTFTFSETVTGFTRDDVVLSDANGTLGEPTTSDNGRTWTATFTPTANVEDSSNTISVNLAGVTNTAGTAGSGQASSTNYSIDTRRPTLTITVADEYLGIGETTTATFTFSEAVTGFTGQALGIYGGLKVSISDPHPSGTSSTVWTATVTPVSNGHCEIGIDMWTVTDLAGNAGLREVTYSANSVIVDLVRPTAASTNPITLADTDLGIGETTTVTFRFSEAITGFALDDIDLSQAHGTLSGLRSTSGDGSSGDTWTALFTPTANTTSLTNTLGINLAGVTDIAGNAGQGSVRSGNYAVKTQGLTATITLADTALAVGETTTVTFTFSETVTGFTRDDVVLSDANGTLGEPTTSDNGTTWTATFTPTANVEDSSNTISVNLAGVTNTAGTAGSGQASSTNYSIDTRRPTVAITVADPDLGIGETTTVTFTFSEAVTGFTIGALRVLSGGSRPVVTISDLRPSGTSGTVWTATVTPFADGDYNIGVDMWYVSDRAGNVSLRDWRETTYLTGNGNNVIVDLVRPTAASTNPITFADTDLGLGETTTVTFRFSEAITGFALDDIDLSQAHGTLSGLRSTSGDGSSGDTWTALFTPTANTTSLTNTLGINLAGVTDIAGNAGQGSVRSGNYAVKTQGLTATITLADTALAVGETTTVTFTFSETVTGFTRDDIVFDATTGTLGEPTTSDNGTTWTATFTPTANVEDSSNTISVNLAGVTNTAGTAGSGQASSANYSIDTRRPTVTITVADEHLGIGETTTITFTFSEAVTGFTLGALRVLSGGSRPVVTISDLRPSGTSGTVWTATVTPFADGDYNIGVDMWYVSDRAGNVSLRDWRETTYLTGNGNNVIVDLVRPTAASTNPITLADTDLGIGETTTVTFRFSEAITGFALDDIDLSQAHGTLSGLRSTSGDGSSGDTWTALFTPTANTTSLTNTIAINLAGVRDIAGNAGQGSVRSGNYIVKTQGLSATITLADTALAAGETTTVTFTFSETVTGFTRDDIVLSDANGTLGEPTTSDNGTTWTATFTPTANANGATNTIRVNLAGVNTAAGTAGTGTASSDNFIVDTTPPVINTATVNGDQLVLTYTEANTLDGAALTGNAGFTVSNAAGTAITVSGASVNATAKTVTLTLSRAVAQGEAVSLSYTKPATGAVVQDAAGNDAADFSNRAVTNNTPDRTPPQLITTGDDGYQIPTISVYTGNLVLRFNDASNLNADQDRKPAAGDFTVLVDGVPRAVTGVTVDAVAKLIKLSLATPPVTHGQHVTVAYQDSTPNDTNGIQDTAGNLLTSFPTTAVLTALPDTTAPALSTATVNGNQLVLTYTDTSSLNGAALAGNAGFTVSSATGTAITVDSAVVHATNKTVTLTLSRAVANGETVTISYAKPATGNGVQDTAHNNAVNFSSRAVTNTTPDTTPPEFSSATVRDNQLVISYTEANTLDGAALTGNAGFAVSSAAGTAITVNSAVVSATDKTVTLTLSRAVVQGEAVSVSYTKPATSAVVQDAAGNDAADFSSRAVTNNTPDRTPPQLITTGDDGYQIPTISVYTGNLVLRFNDASNLNADQDRKPAAGDFTVLVDGVPRAVTGVTVDAVAKLIKLSLATPPVTDGQHVTVAYQDSTPNDTNGIQDTAGNLLTSFPTTAVLTALPDTTAPALSTATVNGNQLVLTYTDTSSLNGAALAGNAGFTVSSATGTAITVDSAVVHATNKTVTLTLSRAVANGETVTISYAKPATGNGVQDTAHNNAADFSSRTVINTTLDTTPPAFSSATVNGNQLVISYTEANTLDGAALAGNAGFTVSSTAGTAITVNSAEVSATAKTVTLTLSRAVVQGEVVSVSYTKPATGAVVQDAAGNDAADFSSRAVTNTTPAADTTPPEFSSATVTGNQLVISYTEANTLDATALAGTAGFTVSGAAGTAITVSNVRVNATAKTVTLTLSRAVTQAETVTVSYAKPESSAVVQDAAGNDAANFTNRTVTNNTPATPAAPTDTTPPEFSSATVRDNLLVISYTEANALDATALTGTAGFTVNSTTGTAITVSSASVDATAKTVTLTLSRAVTQAETVTVSYAKPAAGNGVQDAAHNNAADFSGRAVTNTTPDTTPPEFSSATVRDNQLVISYTEANALDATALTGTAGFTVNSTADTAITVSSASVNATAKTVTLTLSRAVTQAETVTVSYAKPAAGNGVQDAAHNNAADFSGRAVTNNTPATPTAPTDTTPPEFSSATVRDNQLVISYTEANALDATALTGNAGFTVSSTAGTAITVSSARVNATAKTVTLTLSRAVANGETVTISYAKPTTGNGVQDAAHNNAADFSGRAVTNTTPDTTPPVFSSATVTDNQLVISYTEANALDATALTGNAGFTVNSTADTAITVTSAVVSATAKTVTLTLSRAVSNGETVTISYAKPAAGNGVQDVAHNNAADFSSRAVTNTTPDTTPPVFSSATVRDNLLVISYTEANTLDATALAGNAGFTVNSTTGTAITVSSASVDATAKTVTLTLSRAVANGETVTISYAKPAAGNGVQDAAHNNAADFSSRAVTNTTPDTTPPEFSSATVTNNQLVISYTEANTLDATALTGNAGFTVNSTAGTAITVSSASVDATTKTVTLTLSRAVANGETVTVSYAKPAAGNGVQDAAHNNAVDFSGRAVTNNTPATPTAPTDTTPPEFSSATVRDNQLVISYTEANALDATALTGTAGFTVSSTAGTAITVSSAVVSATAKTVTLTLSRAVANGETVTVSYAKPAAGNGVQDAAHNNAVDFSGRAVTNNTPATPTAPTDTTPPEFSSATVRDNQLVISYTEANALDATALTGNAGFTVSSTAGTAITVSSASVDATAKTVTLTLSRAVANGETVTVSYAKPAAGNGVQDAAHNNAVDFSGRAVTNNTPATPATPTDTTPPEFSSATVRDNQLVISYTEANTLDATALAGNAGFTVNSTTGTAITVSSASVNATAKTVTLTLSRAVANGETVTISYAKPTTGNGVQDAAHNNAADFSGRAVTNTTPDTTPPEFSSATVRDNQLVISYTEANTLDATALTGNAGFTVSNTAGTAIAVNSASVNATAKTVTLTLSRAVASDEKLTLSYTKPATGDNVIQDAAGNDAASFGNQAVGNLTPTPTPKPALVPTPEHDPGAPTPKPGPAPTPEHDSGASNADHDGVPDAQENQAIGPRGSARGDGNGDGIQDSAQAAVTSFSAETSSSSSTSVTLVADSRNGKVPSSSNTCITSLEQKAVPAQTPKALETPIALTSFKATLKTAGSTETFSLYVDPEIGANGYWLQDHGGTWVNLASSPYGGKMVDEGGRLRLDFTITDGGAFDADGQANGVITAPGAAAQMPLSIVGQASDGTPGGFWF